MSDAYIQNLIGKEIGGGRYVIRGHLGSGGMSHVLLAQDTNLQRPVALKLLTQSLTADQQVKGRFDAEAKAIALLEHPNIVPIFDYQPATDQTSAFFAMKYLRGGTLRDRIGGGQRYTLEQAADLTRKMASALQYCHDRNIVHRDIKPSNIMFDDNGEPYVVDFGIIKDLETDRTQGFRVGTPEYMAPEQVKGTRVSGGTDQYALAVVIYQTLTGQLPYMVGASSDPSSEYGSSGRPRVKDAKTSGSFMEAALEQEPIDITLMRQDMPTAVWPVLKKAMDKDPSKRWASINEFAQEFENAVRRQGGLSFSRQQRNFLVMGVIAVLILVIGGLLLVLVSGGDGDDPEATQTAVAALQTQDALNIIATAQVFTQTASAEQIIATETSVAATAAQATADMATLSVEQTAAAQIAATETQERGNLIASSTALAATDQAAEMQLTANAEATAMAQATIDAESTVAQATVNAESTNAQATADALQTQAFEATNAQATLNAQGTLDAQATAAQATADAQVLATETQLAASTATQESVIIQSTQDAAATLTAMPTPTPTPMGGGTGQILFHANLDDSGLDIYLFDLATSQMTNLTADSPADDTWAQWSSDGQQIIFFSNRETADGSTDSEIYVMDSSGNNVTQITDNNVSDSDPGYGLNNDEIVFIRLTEANEHQLVYLSNAGEQILYSSIAPIFQPAWSPVDDRVLFQTQFDEGNWDIGLVDVNTGEVTRLTDESSIDVNPAWSPDGSQVLFSSDSEIEGYGRGIFVLDLDSGSISLIVDTEANERLADWQADGSGIIVISTTVDANFISMYSLSGELQRTLIDESTANNPVARP